MIRPYRKEDLESICEIAKRAYKGIFDGFEKEIGKEALECWIPDAWNSKTAQLTLMAQTHPEWLFICERNGRTVGFIMFHLDYTRKLGSIGNNASDPLAGEKGVGQEMYAFALDFFRREGMKVAMVHSGLDEAHAPARRAYERAGFDRTVPEVLYFKMLEEGEKK